MRTHDVVVIGGGPAGATCAWALGHAGADVVVLDRQRFPREKPCAGWITPSVFETIGVTPSEYVDAGCTLQPFMAFQTSVIGEPAIATQFPEPVSYGIRRFEFDAFLLRRLVSPVLEGTPLVSLRREHGAWIVNESMRAPIVVGAGGHFCPVARHLHGGTRRAVVARRMELRLEPDEPCGVSGATPELYFSSDLDGYGWCIRKGRYLNLGIGRRGASAFRSHVVAFAGFLEREGKVPPRAADWRQWQGHAYALAGDGGPAVSDGLVLVGDAAGLAERESGEGIGPAVESACVAAKTIIEAKGRYGTDELREYADWVAAHALPPGLAASLRARVPAFVGRTLLRSPAFARLVIERWFLRTPIPAASPQRVIHTRPSWRM